MEYVRYSILIIILGCSTSIGFLISKKYVDRVKELREIETAINLIKNQIEFTHKPLLEIFEEISNIIYNTSISCFFLNVSNKIKNEKCNIAWNEAIDLEQRNLNLNNKDIDLIKKLGQTLGKTDIDGQISGINQFLEVLKLQILDADVERKKNEKMYKSLGTIVGLVIVIILI